MKFAKVLLINIVFISFLLIGCEKDEKSLTPNETQMIPTKQAVGKNNVSSNEVENSSSNVKIERAKKISQINGEIDTAKVPKNEEIVVNEIYKDVLPPEIESPIVKGLRVNLFAEKKKFKLGEPMNIFVVLRNKSDKMIKLNTKYYNHLENDRADCYFSLSFKGSKYNPYAIGLGVGWPTKVETNLSPNAVFCYVMDIQYKFGDPYFGKYSLCVSLKDEFEKKSESVESNIIEFEVVKPSKNGEEESNRINTDVLPPEIETPIVNGLRVNVFAEKTKFKLGEPMNITVVLRNKSDKMIKLNLKYENNTKNCYFSIRAFNENLPPLTGYTSAIYVPKTVEVNISPNATYCYVMDIQRYFKRGWIAQFQFSAYILDDLPGNTERIKSNTIEFEVTK